jgi:hypothetical protein
MMMIVGVAYHSPLDVVALFPINIKYTIDPNEEADVLITEHVIKEYKARVQIVFASARFLFKANLPIIDQAAWGKIITLTSEQIESLLKKKKVTVAPSWAKFRIK